MARIDCAYEIPHPPEVVWTVLTHPEWEHEHTWGMSGPNLKVERDGDLLRFQTNRDGRETIGRPAAISLFEGRVDHDAMRIHWRITEGFEEGSAYDEWIEPIDDGRGSRVHARGRISMKGIEWDWRLLGTLFPWKARQMVERNICRDYKRIKQWLTTDDARQRLKEAGTPLPEAPA